MSGKPQFAYGPRVWANEYCLKAFVPALLCLVLSLFLNGCRQHPRIDITPRVENGRVVFSIAATGINGLLGLAVMDGTNTLWEIRTSYDKGTRFVYGILPTSGNMPARQVFPPRHVAPAAIDGRRVTVRVDYQYDDAFSACVGHVEKSMQIPKGEPEAEANQERPLGSETSQTPPAPGSRRTP